jgi:hypothetical protein
MIYASGVLSAVQEELLEIKLTILFHQKCQDAEKKDLGCWKKHVVPMLRSTKTQLLLLKSILLRCLLDLTLQEDFRRDCNNALNICQIYLLLQNKVNAHDTSSNRSFFENFYTRLRWNDSSFNSLYLQPFLWPIAEDVSSASSWSYVKDVTFKESAKADWATSSHQENPRLYPDCLFSLLASALFFEDAEDVIHDLITETETAYIKSTAGRHHRIPILTRLLLAWDDLEAARLPVHPLVDFSDPEIRRRAGLSDPAPSLVHPGLLKQDLTAHKMVQQRIEEFAVESLSDGLRGFDFLADLSVDETFCDYLRRRDSLVDVHLDVGLRVLRFAQKI